MGSIKDRQSPGIPSSSAPTGIRRFKYPCIVCQNVAGLWLKYGVKPLKIETSLRSEILLHDATIC